MSGYLVDTNVVSEASRRDPNPGARDWLARAQEDQLYLSVITLGEIRKGIERVSDSERRVNLEKFLLDLRERFGHRILLIDEKVAERWGRMTGALTVRGVTLPAIDSLIAATALHYDLTLVTRNARDFRNAGLSVVNPFDR